MSKASNWFTSPHLGHCRFVYVLEAFSLNLYQLQIYQVQDREHSRIEWLFDFTSCFSMTERNVGYHNRHFYLTISYLRVDCIEERKLKALSKTYVCQERGETPTVHGGFKKLR